MLEILKNRKLLKKKFLNREKLFGGWVSFSQSSIIEILSYVGFDFLAIDMEHAPISLSDSQNIILVGLSNNSVYFDYKKTELFTPGCDV